MSDITLTPVPAAHHICVRCEVYHLPFNLFWVDDMPRWLCGECLDAIGLERKRRRTLDDHLMSLEPRWIPVSERLPPFSQDWQVWHGFLRDPGGWPLAGIWGPQDFKEHDGGWTHWLEFTPPPLPGEEVGG